MFLALDIYNLLWIFDFSWSCCGDKSAKPSSAFFIPLPLPLARTLFLILESRLGVALEGFLSPPANSGTGFFVFSMAGPEVSPGMEPRVAPAVSPSSSSPPKKTPNAELAGLGLLPGGIWVLFISARLNFGFGEGGGRGRGGRTGGRGGLVQWGLCWVL